MPADTTAVTDVAAIAANLAAIRARVGARKILVAIKADAYGHGAVPVATMIEATGSAEWLGVATTQEGLDLRAAGVGLPILRLSPAADPDEVAASITAGIDLTVASRAGVEVVATTAHRLGRRARVHLKVDTGMRRVGCEPADAVSLARTADELGVELYGLFSHLADSDTPQGRRFTRKQIDSFAAVVESVSKARGRVDLVHLANSGGVMQHPESWFDMVRPGVMVYGNPPDPSTEPTVELRPALRWTTQVTFVKPVAAGESVGYGRTWTAPSDTMLATIPVGYGDGYSRRLSNRGRVLIGGRSYPIVGRVCMDQTMINVGAAATVTVNDEVVLLGQQGSASISAQELADLMGTITYEVTSMIGGRVRRRVAGTP